MDILESISYKGVVFIGLRYRWNIIFDV